MLQESAGSRTRVPALEAIEAEQLAEIDASESHVP